LGRPKGGDTIWTLDRKYKQMFDLMKKGISIPNMLKIVADEGEKPQTAKMFHLWIKRWNIKPIGIMSQASESEIATYFQQIEEARPKIKAFLERMESKKSAKVNSHSL